jgi:hypothetical protein
MGAGPLARALVAEQILIAVAAGNQLLVFGSAGLDG